MFLLQVLTSLALASVVWASLTCSTSHTLFKQLNITNPTSYRCDARCMNNSGTVYGTEEYHEDSNVCLAARHIGAIPSSGGNFTIKTRTFFGDFHGAARNRIVSRSWMKRSSGRVYMIEQTSPAVTQEDMREDVVLVHDSNADTLHLHLTCLSQDPANALTSNDIVGWDYIPLVDVMGDLKVEDSRLVLTTSSLNLNAYRCLGRSSATDVVAAIQNPLANYYSPSPTVRFDRGERVTIPIIQRFQKGSRQLHALKMSNDKRRMYINTNQQQLVFGRAQVVHTGIYTVLPTTSGDNKWTGAYFNVIIRECERGTCGVRCNNKCPACQHDGQCHPQTCTCVCPPGFMGATCQHACLPGRFGAMCQLGCDQETLGFAVAREGDCAGLIACVPEPYGCSCLPGYTYSPAVNVTNPLCTRECPLGTFGANCSETCTDCNGGLCDRFTGTCNARCEANCIQAPPAPRVSITSRHRGMRINLPVNSGEDVVYFITVLFQRRRHCGRRRHVRKNYLVETSSTAIVSDLEPYSEYQVRVVASNLGGHSPPSTVTGHTLPEEPPPAQDLRAIVANSSAIQLFWNNPCPSNGLITDVEIRLQRRRIKHSPQEKCLFSDVFDGCHTITGLTLGKNYTFKVRVRNDCCWSQWAAITVKLEIRSVRKPGPPESISSVSKSREIVVSVHSPLDHGGQSLTNCTVSLSGKNVTCTMHRVQSNFNSSCKLVRLAKGKVFQAEAFCCNTKFCGDALQHPVATMPLIPELLGPPAVVRTTNTTIVLQLPRVITKGDGNSSMAVVIQQENQNTTKDVTAEVKRLLSAARQQNVREERDDGQSCQQAVWIAGLLTSEGNVTFVVGDGRSYHGFINCPLQTNQGYHVGIMAITELLGERSYAWELMAETVMLEPWSLPASLPEAEDRLLGAYVAVIIIVFFLLMVFCVLWWLRKIKQITIPSQENVQEQSDTNHETFTESIPITGVHLQSPPLHPRAEDEMIVKFIPREPVYENVIQSDNVYDVIRERIPKKEVEAYLNLNINSVHTREQFKSVPMSFKKSTTAAQHPSNVAKNRATSHLPYDDTRVKLSVVEGDPNSDYINANHISGYGGVRYIAAQGPKNRDISTLADFWRMVIEYDISVIIMVADFTEGGQSHVAEYLNHDCFEGHSVTVTNVQHNKNYMISSVQVKDEKGHSHAIQHYHYTNWSKYSLPDEPASLADMIRRYQSDHQTGGTVVHGCTGLDRTGVVLQVLLSCEMLARAGVLTPVDILLKLRNCRAGLIEHYDLYNFSMRVLEEVLFGEETSVSPSELQNSLDYYVREGAAQFKRVKALRSPLTYKTARNSVLQTMNRNTSVLPSDSRRVYLCRGEDVVESQYINAVWVEGLTNREKLIATEHPLSDMVVKFWRLVVEHKCSVIILINTFGGHSQDEFPQLVGEVGEVFSVPHFSMKLQKVQPYGSSILLYTLEIEHAKLCYKVEVYQVLSWPYGEDLPSSPDLLQTLAQLILQRPPGPQISPIVISCGDGVTGCGLVAAVTLLLDDLHNKERVDVYRTAVKLLRNRSQFIINERQYCRLYEEAVYHIAHNPHPVTTKTL